MSDTVPVEPKPPGRGTGPNAIAGHEQGQNAAIDGLVAAVAALTERVVFLENEADTTP